jgi:hypothetical protein
MRRPELGKTVGGVAEDVPGLNWRYWKVEDVEAHPPMPSERRGVVGIDREAVR